MEPASTNSRTSLELIQAYVKFKESRKASEELKQNSKDLPPADSLPAPVFAELPSVLQIRRKPLTQQGTSTTSAKPHKAICEERCRAWTLDTPMVADLSKSSALFAEHVSQLSKNIAPSKPVRDLGILRNQEKSEEDATAKVYAVRRHGLGNLSDVTEEEEFLASNSSRNSDRADSVRRVSESRSSGTQEGEVNQNHPGSARMVDNIQKLQQINETLLKHLKKTIAAYKELTASKELAEEKHSSELTEVSNILHRQTAELRDHKSQLDHASEKLKHTDGELAEERSRSQIVEIKLAQALNRNVKLQKEIEDLKTHTDQAIESTTERALLGHVMDLEAEASRSRVIDITVEELNSRLEAKDAQIRLLSQRGATMAREVTSSMSDKQTATEKVAVREVELSKTSEKLASAEYAYEEMTKELRVVKQELEEKTWRLDKVLRDMEKLTKEKDRAYEKVYETQQEMDEQRRKERKELETKLTAALDEVESYKEKLKRVEKELVKFKVRQEELNVQHREDIFQMKSRIGDLSAINKKYQEQLQMISDELLNTNLDEV